VGTRQERVAFQVYWPFPGLLTRPLSTTRRRTLVGRWCAAVRFHQCELHRKLLGQTLAPMIRTIFPRPVSLTEGSYRQPALLLFRDQLPQKSRRASCVFDMSPVSVTCRRSPSGVHRMPTIDCCPFWNGARTLTASGWMMKQKAERPPPPTLPGSKDLGAGTFLGPRRPVRLLRLRIKSSWLGFAG
jgi:hypothetical protein